MWLEADIPESIAVDYKCQCSSRLWMPTFLKYFYPSLQVRSTCHGNTYVSKVLRFEVHGLLKKQQPFKHWRVHEEARGQGWGLAQTSLCETQMRRNCKKTYSLLERQSRPEPERVSHPWVRSVLHFSFCFQAWILRVRSILLFLVDIISLFLSLCVCPLFHFSLSHFIF